MVVYFRAGQGLFMCSVWRKAYRISKGKSAVEVGTAEELINTLEIIRKATLAGELDTQIEQVSGAVKAAFKK